MAFFQQQQDDEQKRRQSLTPGAAPPPVAAGGGSAGSPGAPSAPKGSGFVNIGRYLDANKAQGQAMGDRLMNDAAGAANGVMQGVQDARAKTSEAAVAGFGQAKGYGGPAGLLEPAGLAGQAADAQKKLDALKTVGGTAQALTDTFGRSTNGGNALDSLLTESTSGQGLRTVGRDGAGSWGTLGNYLDSARTGERAAAAQNTKDKTAIDEKRAADAISAPSYGVRQEAPRNVAIRPEKVAPTSYAPPASVRPTGPIATPRDDSGWDLGEWFKRFGGGK